MSITLISVRWEVEVITDSYFDPSGVITGDGHRMNSLVKGLVCALDFESFA